MRGVPVEPVFCAKSRRVIIEEQKHLGLTKTDQKFGLALSGGGIRSASFALGVLQALYGFGVFEKFHYLSTVSGGGYIGTSLTYFRNIFNTKAAPGWFPFGYLQPPGQAPIRAMGARVAAPQDADSKRAQRIVTYLRQHAAFLVPSRQLGLPALAAGALRGLITTSIPYFALLAGILGLLCWAGAFDKTGEYDFLLATDWPAAATSVPPAGCSEDKCEAKSLPPPDIYLAIWPANLALWIAVLFLATAALSSVVAGAVARLDQEEKLTRFGYRSLVKYYSLAGWALTVGVALAVLSTMPWLREYLNYLMDAQADQQLPGTFAALGSALAGAVGLVAKMRGVLGGESLKPSLTRRLVLSLAGILFVFGILFLGFMAGWSLAGPETARTWLYAGLLFLAAIAIAWTVNVNLAAQHRLYRDRLMEVFCAQNRALKAGSWRYAYRAQSSAGWMQNMIAPKTPYHIINTCVITTDSDDRRFRGRGGDNFILSPLYCGSDATGWAATDVAQPTLSIATAAAISGAALNAHSGPHGAGLLRNKAYSAVLSFLGLHLGYWARNPQRYRTAKRRANADARWVRWCSKLGMINRNVTGVAAFKVPNLIIPGLFSVSGIGMNEIGTHVQLSDGGHFENLAIYELVRRRVDFMWISDAGQDAVFSFEDLSNAIERVRVDFGVNIRFRNEDYDLTHLFPGSAETPSDASKNFADLYKLARRGYAVGTVEYPDGKVGTVVYIKSTLTRGLPADIYGYKARNPDFPHQTTMDQFFDEEQFDAYRELGYRLAAQFFRDIDKYREEKALLPSGLVKAAAYLGLPF